MMDAETARKATDRNIAGPVVQKYIKIIDEKISEACRMGESGVHDPQAIYDENGRRYRMGNAQLEAIIKHYITKGFSWVDHPSPDPGHPCSRPYTTIEW